MGNLFAKQSSLLTYFFYIIFFEELEKAYLVIYCSKKE